MSFIFLGTHFNFSGWLCSYLYATKMTKFRLGVLTNCSDDMWVFTVLNKIKMLEYQGCTCGTDKQEIYEELWKVLQHLSLLRRCEIGNWRTQMFLLWLLATHNEIQKSIAVVSFLGWNIWSEGLIGRRERSMWTYVHAWLVATVGNFVSIAV